jgi:hypothetical protein
MGKSFHHSNGYGNSHGNDAGGQGPATVTITGVRLGAGDTHWWKLV